MHMVIYALVEAPTQHDALVEGNAVFDRLVGAKPHGCVVFDYYRTFDEDETTVAGKARWGDLPMAAPINSAAGGELLDRAWRATTDAFQRHLDRVREALEEFSDEAIMRDEDLARHAFHQVGAYEGPSIPMYDQHAQGIRHRGKLDRVLEEKEDSQTLWIVFADVHF